MGKRVAYHLVYVIGITSKNLELRKKLSGLTETIGMMKKNLAKTEEQLDALEQYGRHDNLEIHNIPWTENEKTNEIVIDCKHSSNKLKLPSTISIEN